MKWLKHDTTARNDTRIKLLKRAFGAEGYGVYFQLLEIVGENIKEKNHEDWAFVENVHTVETLADEVGVTPDKLRTMLEYCNEIGLVYKINGRLCIPKILGRLDEYARKRKGDFDVEKRQKELSRQTPDNVRTKSGECPGLEQKRTEQKRTEQKRTEEKLQISAKSGNGIKVESSDKDSLATGDAENNIKLGAEINRLIALFEPVNPSYKRLYSNKTQRAALNRMVTEHGIERIEQAIRSLPLVVGKQFAPTITTPLELEKGMGRLIAYLKKEQVAGGKFAVTKL